MRFLKIILSVIIVLFSQQAEAQRFLTDMMDTTTTIGKGIYPLYGKHDRLKFGGYMQPQFQWTETKGTKNYSGGDFSPNANNRFMLRRGRIRIDYGHFNEEGKPLALFAFQFDGTERGVNIRDFWGRFYENKMELFSLSAGMFARPMGFEANLSSSDRETPERGRMSQILMKTERDIGMMLTIDPRRTTNPIKKYLKLDIGVFNGQGLAGPAEYDNHKDIIGRLYLKSQKLNKTGWALTGSVSGYLGGITSQSPVLYKVVGNGEHALMMKDSATTNINYVAPRKYAGADVQLKIPNQKGYTEFRAEYIRGVQTATASTSETPGSYPVTSTNGVQPLYIRNFDGVYFYYLQHLGINNLQFIAKYDWYDPNKNVKGKEVDAAKGFTAADVRYNTLGFGFLYYINVHVKAFLYYDHITNEATNIAGYNKDLKDDILTFRLQYRF